MKLPARAHTFNFPPRGRAHPPRRTAVSQAGYPSFHNQRQTVYFSAVSLLSPKSASPSFSRYQYRSLGKQASGFIFFFYRYYARYQRPFHRCRPPLSVPLLSLGTVGVVDSMFDIASALSGSIGHVTKARLPSSLTRKSMVMPALALKRTVQAARER